MKQTYAVLKEVRETDPGNMRNLKWLRKWQRVLASIYYTIPHDGSMGMVYLPNHEWLILMVNVGKYTIPMDPMGTYIPPGKDRWRSPLPVVLVKIMAPKPTPPFGSGDRHLLSLLWLAIYFHYGVCYYTSIHIIFSCMSYDSLFISSKLSIEFLNLSNGGSF